MKSIMMLALPLLASLAGSSPADSVTVKESPNTVYTAVEAGGGAWVVASTAVDAGGRLSWEGSTLELRRASGVVTTARLSGFSVFGLDALPTGDGVRVMAQGYVRKGGPEDLDARSARSRYRLIEIGAEGFRTAWESSAVGVERYEEDAVRFAWSLEKRAWAVAEVLVEGQRWQGYVVRGGALDGQAGRWSTTIRLETSAIGAVGLWEDMDLLAVSPEKAVLAAAGRVWVLGEVSSQPRVLAYGTGSSGPTLALSPEESLLAVSVHGGVVSVFDLRQAPTPGRSEAPVATVSLDVPEMIGTPRLLALRGEELWAIAGRKDGRDVVIRLLIDASGGKVRERDILALPADTVFRSLDPVSRQLHLSQARGGDLVLFTQPLPSSR